MEKKIKFCNAIVYIKKPSDEQIEKIRMATETYLTKLVKEGCFDDNVDTSRNFREK